MNLSRREWRALVMGVKWPPVPGEVTAAMLDEVMHACEEFHGARHLLQEAIVDRLAHNLEEDSTTANGVRAWLERLGRFPLHPRLLLRLLRLIGLHLRSDELADGMAKLLPPTVAALLEDEFNDTDDLRSVSSSAGNMKNNGTKPGEIVSKALAGLQEESVRAMRDSPEVLGAILRALRLCPRKFWGARKSAAFVNSVTANNELPAMAAPVALRALLEDLDADPQPIKSYPVEREEHAVSATIGNGVDPRKVAHLVRAVAAQHPGEVGAFTHAYWAIGVGGGGNARAQSATYVLAALCSAAMPMGGGDLELLAACMPLAEGGLLRFKTGDVESPLPLSRLLTRAAFAPDPTVQLFIADGGKGTCTGDALASLALGGAKACNEHLLELIFKLRLRRCWFQLNDRTNTGTRQDKVLRVLREARELYASPALQNYAQRAAVAAAIMHAFPEDAVDLPGKHVAEMLFLHLGAVRWPLDRTAADIHSHMDDEFERNSADKDVDTVAEQLREMHRAHTCLSTTLKACPQALEYLSSRVPISLQSQSETLCVLAATGVFSHRNNTDKETNGGGNPGLTRSRVLADVRLRLLETLGVVTNQDCSISAAMPALAVLLQLGDLADTRECKVALEYLTPQCVVEGLVDELAGSTVGSKVSVRLGQRLMLRAAPSRIVSGEQEDGVAMLWSCFLRYITRSVQLSRAGTNFPLLIPVKGSASHEAGTATGITVDGFFGSWTIPLLAMCCNAHFDALSASSITEVGPRLLTLTLRLLDLQAFRESGARRCTSTRPKAVRTIRALDALDSGVVLWLVKTCAHDLKNLQRTEEHDSGAGGALPDLLRALLYSLQLAERRYNALVNVESSSTSQQHQPCGRRCRDVHFQRQLLELLVHLSYPESESTGNALLECGCNHCSSVARADHQLFAYLFKSLGNTEAEDVVQESIARMGFASTGLLTVPTSYGMLAMRTKLSLEKGRAEETFLDLALLCRVVRGGREAITAAKIFGLCVKKRALRSHCLNNTQGLADILLTNDDATNGAAAFSSSQNGVSLESALSTLRYLVLGTRLVKATDQFHMLLRTSLLSILLDLFVTTSKVPMPLTTHRFCFLASTAKSLLSQYRSAIKQQQQEPMEEATTLCELAFSFACAWQLAATQRLSLAAHRCYDAELLAESGTAATPPRAAAAAAAADNTDAATPMWETMMQSWNDSFEHLKLVCAAAVELSPASMWVNSRLCFDQKACDTLAFCWRAGQMFLQRAVMSIPPTTTAKAVLMSCVSTLKSCPEFKRLGTKLDGKIRDGGGAGWFVPQIPRKKQNTDVGSSDEEFVDSDAEVRPPPRKRVNGLSKRTVAPPALHIGQARAARLSRLAQEAALQQELDHEEATAIAL